MEKKKSPDDKQLVLFYMFFISVHFIDTHLNIYQRLINLSLSESQEVKINLNHLIRLCQEKQHIGVKYIFKISFFGSDVAGSKCPSGLQTSVEHPVMCSLSPRRVCEGVRMQAV